MLEEQLREYGLSARQIANLIKYFKTVDGIIDSEDYEIASIGDMSIAEARKLKNYLSQKIEKRGIGRDFLKRWGGVVSQTNIESAYEEYDKLSKMYPKSPVVWQIKAELLEKMGRYKEAKDAYLQAYKLYEERNEIPPSVIEDKVRGKLFHAKNGGNGVGLINGFGMMNGKSIINGLSMDFKHGFRNGIINGSGLVNGTRKGVYGGKGKTPRYLRFFTALIIILILIYTPLLGTILFEKKYPFRVDGNFGEWQSVMPYYALKSYVPGYMDITLLKFHISHNGVYFFIETREAMFTNASGIYIFIDGDMNSYTGYLVSGIGADYMVEIYGWNQTVRGASFYIFNSSNQKSFSGFESMFSIPTALRGNKLEGFIAHKITTFRTYVITTDYSGRHDMTYIPVEGRERAIVLEDNDAHLIKLGEKISLLKINIYTYGKDMKIKNITFDYYGTSTPFDMKDMYLYLDDGNGIFDSSDSLIGADWTIKEKRYVFFGNFDIQIHKNTTIFLVVRCNDTNALEKTAMMKIASIGSDLPYYVVNRIDEAIYIGRIPNNVYIDGSFDDWKIVKSDPVGDVITPGGTYKSSYENVDIINYSSFNGVSTYFYVEVNGKMMGGDDSPILRRFVLPDSDRDTVPDRFDPLPHDFNNDHIPDNESYVIINGTKLPDVDKDGIADYPYGNDMWLNTTIPSWFPKPYAGKKVHIYIGPVPHREIYGYDTLRIYVNADGNTTTGFSLPHYPIGADYMVEIYGRDGNVENATTYRYHNGKWTYFSDVKYYLGYHQIEIASGIHASNTVSLFVLSDWNGDHDMSDTPFHSSLPTRSNEVHKQLHLHYNATTSTPYLNTTTGSVAYYAQIYAGNTVTWIQIPSFAKDFSISSYPRVQLYLEPYVYQWWWWRFIPGINVSLWIYNSSTGYREIGYDFNPDIENTGWYNFTISNTTEIKREEMLLLNISVTGIRYNYINVYFNSTQYDSKIDLPTTTYINVDWIKTYNSSAETDTFNPDENIYIRARISDPFGSYDIKEAEITIYYPNGTKVIDNQSMDILNVGSSYITFNYHLLAPEKGGVYKVVVYAVESNGVISSNTTYFIVVTNQGVALYPDQTKNALPEENVSFNLILRNIGNVKDTYEIISSEPTSRFPFSLYINGSLAAKDNDGDGKWDWINSSWDPDNDGYVEVTLLSLQQANITIIKHVPLGTWGKTDLTVFNATSEANSSVYDNARIRVNVPYLNLNKVLYLNDTNQLAVKHGTTTQSVTINYGRSYTWSFSQVYYDVNLTSYITVNLYMNAQESSWSACAIKASLYADSTLIGDDEIIGNGQRWYTFTIDPQIDVIPAGSSISLVVSVSGYLTSATVYYDSYQYPSNVTIPTTDYIKIRYLKLFNSSGEETYTFAAGEDVIVRTRITSPFGMDDIGITYLNITDPTESKAVDSASMQLVSSSGGNKIYEYTYSLPSDAWSGYWDVRVDVHDDPVISTNASTQFFIPWNVSVEPDHNLTTNVSDKDRYLFFTHTITNTGWGANIFEIVATSSNGFDIQLIINGNLAAEDYNGDGVWDYVNPNYDFDGDGSPDTGILLPGQSLNITIAVKVPANFTGNETVDVEAYSFLSQSVNDHAYDKINVVPEINPTYAFLMTLLLAAIITIKRRRRFIPSSSQSR